jgi:chlorite dismutase
MKTKEQILEKIKSLKSHMDSICEERDELMNKHGGIGKYQNEDMMTDITITSYQIKMLEWVLSK